MKHAITYTTLSWLLIASLTLNYLTFHDYKILPPDKRTEQVQLMKDIFENADIDKGKRK